MTDRRGRNFAAQSLKRQFALASLVKTETEGVFSLDVLSSAWTAAIIPVHIHPPPSPPN
jgi:hypothetical protein